MQSRIAGQGKVGFLFRSQTPSPLTHNDFLIVKLAMTNASTASQIACQTVQDGERKTSWSNTSSRKVKSSDKCPTTNKTS